MKVICDRSALAEGLTLVSGVVVSRTPKPVYACVKLVASKDGLRLYATDGEIGLELGIEQVNVEEPGEALVPADKLNQIVRASDDSTLTIEVKEHTAHVRGQGAHFTIYGFDPKEFPQVRNFGELESDCEIPAQRLQKLVARTLFATAAESSRYAINGVLFDRKGKKLRMVATDGRRLAVSRGDCQKSADGDTSCIIPTKALNLVLRLIDDPDAPIRIAVDENQILFAVGEGLDAAVLSSNLVEGVFPPFEDVIPRDQDKKVTFNRDALSSAVRRAALLTNEESKGVRMSFREKELTLTSRAPEMGEAEINIDLESYSGEPIEIGFNPGYLVDALKVVDDAEVIIELKAANKPGVLKAGQDFTYVVMPVNLQ